MAKEKKKMSTLHKRNWLKVGKVGLKGGAYAAPFVPMVVMTGINWDEWFIQSKSGIHVATGFIMLIVSTLLTYLSIAKKKNLLEKVSAFWNVAIIVICWAVSLLFLSSILSDLGFMLLYIGFGVIASACMDEVEARIIEPKYQEYKQLVSDYGLDKREVRKKEKEIQRRKQAEQEAELEARKQAID